MNKSIKIITLGLLTSGMLMGCNKSGGGTAKTWSNEQLNLFNTYTHGITPIYTNSFGKLEVNYNEDYGAIYVNGGQASEAKLEAYADKFVKAGWTYTSGETVGEYFFSTYVETEEVNRYATAYFYGVDEYGYASVDGNFQMQFYDPYVYEFPSEFVAEAASILFGSDIVAPAVTADRYYCDYQNGCLECYLESKMLDAGYSMVLDQSSDWKVLEKKDYSNYFVANSSDGRYSLRYLNYPSLGVFVIYFDNYAYLNKDVEVERAIFEKYAEYGATYFDVPTPAKYDDSKVVELYEAPTNKDDVEWGDYAYLRGCYEFAAVESQFDLYTDLLEANGWILTEQEHFVYENTAYVAKKLIDGQFRKIFTAYDPDNCLIEIDFYLVGEEGPKTVWPSDEEFKSTLPSFVTDTLPAFNGENYGYYYDLEESGNIRILVDATTAIDKMEAYFAYLVSDCGFTSLELESDNPAAISPNGQYELFGAIYAEGEIQIWWGLADVKIDKPQEIVDSFLKDLGKNPASVPVPEFAGATWNFSYFENGFSFGINQGLTENDGHALFNLACAGAVGLGYDESEITDEWDVTYVNTTLGLEVNIYTLAFDDNAAFTIIVRLIEE